MKYTSTDCNLLFLQEVCMFRKWILCFSLLGSFLFGQAKTDTTYQAVRLTGTVHIDGDLSESVWQNVPVITGFYQYDPDEGKPASQKTEIRIAYDDDAMYVGARCYDSAPDSILARLARRDEVELWRLILIMTIEAVSFSASVREALF